VSEIAASQAEDGLKLALEILSESCAAAAALLWFISARVRMMKRSTVKRGLASIDDPKHSCVWSMSKVSGARGQQ
jgi:hypothetical protein